MNPDVAILIGVGILLLLIAYWHDGHQGGGLK